MKELSEGEAAAALQQLYDLVQRGKVTLLYSSRNQERNNAVVLKDLLEGARKPPTGTGPAAARAMRSRQAARAPRR
jgi:hypothetical protein